jgi:hypothetical protein
LKVIAASRVDVVFQEFAHGGSEVRPYQGEGDLRFEEADLVAAIEAFALIFERR